MLRLPDPSVLAVYVDESSQTKHRHLVLGGIVCTPQQATMLAQLIMGLRLPELPASELKWTKVSASKMAAYKRVVDAFFDRSNFFAGPLHFHSLTVELAHKNDRAFSGGDREIGFNKEIYQLLMKCARLYPKALFHAYPDHRETKTAIDELRLILNRGIKKKGDQREAPFRRVHFRNSRDEPLIQLADLFIGAIAFKLNGHHSAPESSRAKCELCDYILSHAGITDVTRDTQMSGKFTIWHRRLQRVPRP